MVFPKILNLEKEFLPAGLEVQMLYKYIGDISKLLY